MEIERLIDALIEREGGYVNHPNDRGGPTKYGITEAVARAHGYSGAMRDLRGTRRRRSTSASIGFKWVRAQAEVVPTGK